MLREVLPTLQPIAAEIPAQVSLPLKEAAISFCSLSSTKHSSHGLTETKTASIGPARVCTRCSVWMFWVLAWCSWCGSCKWKTVWTVFGNVFLLLGCLVHYLHDGFCLDLLYLVLSVWPFSPRGLLFSEEEMEERGSGGHRRSKSYGVEEGESVVRKYCMREESVFNKTFLNVDCTWRMILKAPLTLHIHEAYPYVNSHQQCVSVHTTMWLHIKMMSHIQ